MLPRRPPPTSSVLEALVRSPSSISSLPQLQQLHALVLRSTPSLSSHRHAAVLSAYSRLGLPLLALRAFSLLLPSPSPLSWTTIIRSSSSHGLFPLSLSLFLSMRSSSLLPSHELFPSLLRSCTALRHPRLALSLHAFSITLGLHNHLYTANALLNLYCKLSVPHDPEYLRCAWKVFDTMPIRDLVSWNTVIVGFAENGLHREALQMLEEMCADGMKPDSFTLSSILPIFAEYVDVAKGMEIHGYAMRHGFDMDVFIGSSLIDMYANCTRVEYSSRVFDRLSDPDVISWNSLIAAFVQNGMCDQGLRLFRRMLKAGLKPKPATFSSVTPACAYLTTLHLGKQIHCYVIRSGFDDNVYVASALLDMYAKCGNIRVARWIFDGMASPDLVSWTAMIMGYALHGPADEALTLFQRMEGENAKPNFIAFLAVLTACSHAGLVDEAWGYFNSMRDVYHIVPSLEHYAAVADVLGRAGKLEEAYDFISKMHINPTACVWSTLLGACCVHKNPQLAEKVADKMLSLEPENMNSYILMSNIYSAAGRWKDAKSVRVAMRGKGIRKIPACSWIEVKNSVHAFFAHDKSHPCYREINEALAVISELMEREGYRPNLDDVLHDVEDEQKKDMLCGHSERLAIAFGIISTPAATVIRVTKNLRVCVDCHTVIKFISKVVGREIVVRDTNRFHYFKNGACSCGDYW